MQKHIFLPIIKSCILSVNVGNMAVSKIRNKSCLTATNNHLIVQ